MFIATCLGLLRQHGLLDGFCHMRALLGLVEVDVDTYVEYQRQDENHMGDSTPRRTPALGRLQPKSVFSIWDAKFENLVATSEIGSGGNRRAGYSRAI